MGVYMEQEQEPKNSLPHESTSPHWPIMSRAEVLGCVCYFVLVVLNLAAEFSELDQKRQSVLFIFLLVTFIVMIWSLLQPRGKGL
jgi:uncharacterized membrane protein